MDVIVCLSTCYACKFGYCPERWHSWADQDDIEHALSLGKPNPSDRRCNCPCADAPKVE